MFSMDVFCFSCLKNKNSLVEVTTSINDVTYEEKLTYCRLYYNIPEDCCKLLCDLCCESINNVYEYKKMFMEKQELLQTYIQSLEQQKNGKKLQKMSVNIVNCHQYIPPCQNGVMNVDLTQDDQIFDLTADDDEIDETLFDRTVNNVDYTLSNPFAPKEPKIEEIVEENTETNELLEVIVKTKEEDMGEETTEVENEREFINSLPRIEENYEIVEDQKVSVNKNGLKMVIRRNNSESSEEKEKFECVYCGKIFYNIQNLKRHKLSHPTHNIPCRICKKVLKNRQSYQLHMSLHSSDYKKYKCNLCNKGYTQKNNLILHRANKHLKNFDTRYPSRSQSTDSKENIITENLNLTREITSATVDPKNLEEFQKTLKYCNTVVAKRGRPRKYQTDGQKYCKKCNYHFARNDAYVRHFKMFHTNYTCDTCQKVFDNKKALSLHIRSQTCRNHNEIKIYCEQCDQYFSTSANYNKHIDSAHTEHKCQKCQIQFANKIKLRHHQKKNQCQANLKCEFCSRTFKLTMHLNNHLKTHIEDDMLSNDVINDDTNDDTNDINNDTNEKTEFNCDKCDKTFSNKVKLDLHLLVHSGVYNFPCKYCPHLFTTKDQLQSHVTRIHRNKIYTCKLCLKSFKTVLYYKRHMLQHSNFAPKLPCEFCDKTFTKLRHLRNHKKTHTASEKVITCTECPKVFLSKCNLVRHMVVHTNERKHVCKYCGRKFNLGNILVRHIKMMHEDDELFENGVKMTVDAK